MAVNLSPVGGVAAQFFTNTGAVLTGGKLYTYLAGTTTPATTYTTSAGNVARTNPIILDAAGRVSGSGEIWLTSGVSYKFLLRDSADVLIGTYDNVYGISDVTLPISSNSVTYLPAGAGAVATTVQTKLRESVSVQDFGAVGDGATNDTAAIQAALTANVGGDIYFPKGIYLITATLKIDSNTRIYGVGESSRIKTVANIVMLEGVNPAIIYSPIVENLTFENQFPVSDVVFSTVAATTTSGSPTVAVASVAGLKKSMRVSGTNIPAGTVIRYVSRTGGNDFTLGNATGTALVNATGSGATTLTLSYRQGQTNFHIYFKNSIRAQFYNVTFNTAFNDTEYSPNNHAGIWLDRDSGGGYFVASIESCFFNKGQILCGISDSNIKNSVVWGNPFDYAIQLSGPGCTVEGCNVSAGVNGAIITTATGTEASGGSNHTIVGNNIDGGSVWYTGYGVQLFQPLNVTLVGNRINLCQKAGIYMTDAVNCAITGNGFLKNNEDDALFSDIENVGIAFGSNRVTVTGNSFFNTTKTYPGYAIKEVNGGAIAVANTYSSNTVSANYLSPSFLVLQPYNTENDINAGSVANGITAFTPTFVSVTLGNGTVEGWYKRSSSQITLYASLTFGSTTVVTGQIGVTSLLPALQPALGSASGFDSSPSALYSSVSTINTASSSVLVYSNNGVGTYWNATTPFTWATGDVLQIQITHNV
jgi:parallel beta-helix repeat protein